MARASLATAQVATPLIRPCLVVVQSIVMSVSVCLSVCISHNHTSDNHIIFCATCARSWLRPLV